MKPTAADFLKYASQSTIAANPRLSATITRPNAYDDSTGILRATRGGWKSSSGLMNKTEAEFALMLKAQKCNGEILRWEFEGITLRWADMRYTPDFFVAVRHCSSMPECHQFKCIEIKGGHIWDRDIVRFKGARAYWPEFAFEMHQKTKQGWKRIR